MTHRHHNYRKGLTDPQMLDLIVRADKAGAPLSSDQLYIRAGVSRSHAEKKIKQFETEGVVVIDRTIRPHLFKAAVK